jgi:ketosteroid isomerase-like protein
MRFRQLLIISLLCGAHFRSPAQETSPDVAKILSLESRYTDAYRQHNVTVMKSLLAEDFVMTIEDGRVFGKIGYISHTAESSVQVDLAEESDLRVHMHGNVAIVTGAYHETGTSNGKRYEYHDRLTDVWMRIDGQWLLIASQYSVPVQQ